jgi:hypothetical protein
VNRLTSTVYRLRIASAASYYSGQAELQNIRDLGHPVSVETRMNPSLQEYYTRNGGNRVLPAVESEHGREQSTSGQRADAQAGWRQCTNCGKSFEPSKYSAHKQKYCSYRCKRSARTGGNKEMRLEKMGHSPRPNDCPQHERAISIGFPNKIWQAKSA